VGVRLALAMALLLGTAAARGAEIANPPDLQFTLAVPKTTFAIGEEIPVTLIFVATGARRWSVWTNNYPPCNQMAGIWFEVKGGPPHGWSDPLAACWLWDSGGGSSGAPEAAEAGRVELPVPLNDWVRFEAPGDYTVTCSTIRALPPDAKTDYDSPGRIPLRAPPLTLHLVAPDVAWQARTMAATKAYLDRYPISDPIFEPQERALSCLAWLGTEAAYKVPLEACTGNGWDRTWLRLGFYWYGRPGATRLIEQVAAEPTVAVDDGLVSLYEALAVPPEVMSARPAGGYTEAWEYWDRRRRGIQRAAAAKLQAIALAALPTKAGGAAEVTRWYLVAQGQGTEEMKRAILYSLERLDPGRRQQWLTGRWWRIIKCPEAEAVLARLVEIEPDAERSEWEYGGSLSAAVTCYREYQPDKVRAIIQADIVRPRPRLSRVLDTSLTRADLPANYDAVLVRNLEDRAVGCTSCVAGLAEAYGGPAVLPAVKALLLREADLHTLGCEAVLLRFWLKYDRPGGMAEIERETAGNEGFRSQIVREVLSYFWAPDAQAMALRWLDDPSVFGQTFDVCCRLADAAGLDALIDRAEKLTRPEVPYWHDWSVSVLWANARARLTPAQAARLKALAPKLAPSDALPPQPATAPTNAPPAAP